jgi:hypothetical protein
MTAKPHMKRVGGRWQVSVDGLTDYVYGSIRKSKGEWAWIYFRMRQIAQERRHEFSKHSPIP